MIVPEDEPRPASEPVVGADRVASVDVLRGVALLGILAMNIVGFAWPFPVYDSPTLAPGYSWEDLALWMFTYIVFDTKMMTIFSMLFGAGLVLMSDRADARGTLLRRIYYRRVFFLLVIGLCHAYLIWAGDILVLYALCGFALYPFRRLSGRTLVVIGVLLLCLAFPTWFAMRAAIRFLDTTIAQVKAEAHAGVPRPDWRLDVLEIRKKIGADEKTRAKRFRDEITLYRGSYRQIVAYRIPAVFEMHLFAFLFGEWWLIGGRMILGMGLMKLGVFSACRTPGFYRRLAFVGYAVGLPMVFADIAIDWHHDFFKREGLAYATEGWWLIRETSGPFLTLGHVGVVMILYQSNTFAQLMRKLAAVGRMALSNYLLQSIVCTTLFYGYGFGLFARIHRLGLVPIVLAIWAFQLNFSPFWLARFRFGPAEWIWRSLTYGAPQPFRREPRLAVAADDSPPASTVIAPGVDGRGAIVGVEVVGIGTEATGIAEERRRADPTPWCEPGDNPGVRVIARGGIDAGLGIDDLGLGGSGPNADDRQPSGNEDRSERE